MSKKVFCRFWLRKLVILWRNKIQKFPVMFVAFVSLLLGWPSNVFSAENTERNENNDINQNILKLCNQPVGVKKTTSTEWYLSKAYVIDSCHSAVIELLKNELYLPKLSELRWRHFFFEQGLKVQHLYGLEIKFYIHLETHFFKMSMSLTGEPRMYCII